MPEKGNCLFVTVLSLVDSRSPPARLSALSLLGTSLEGLISFNGDIPETELGLISGSSILTGGAKDAALVALSSLSNASGGAEAGGGGGASESTSLLSGVESTAPFACDCSARFLSIPLVGVLVLLRGLSRV